MKRVRALGAGLTLLFLLTAGNANASSFTLGSVSIDWRALTFSGISIEFIDGTLSSAADASAVSGDVSDFDASMATGWTGVSALATASTVVGDWSAEAGASASTADAEITAFASQRATLAGRSASEANASRDVSFVVRQTGILTVSVPETISTQISVELPEGENAFIHAFANLYLMESPNVYTIDSFDSDFRQEGVGNSSETISQTRTVSRFFQAGQQGRFLAQVGADGFANSVPEPATALLVGSGIAALVLCKRRTGQARTTPVSTPAWQATIPQSRLG